MRSHSRTARTGFTLIELLVVIAIIAILAGLIVGAVMMVRGKGEEAKTNSEIAQLDSALQTFKTTTWNVPMYPPDQLKLCMNYSEYNTANAVDVQSLQFLSAMFPNLGSFSGIQWAGPGVTIPAGGVVLEGDQVLVFCLGGPPAGTGTNLLGGFSTNPKDPIDPTNSATNRKKNFTFDNARLKSAPRTGNTAATYFPSYIDPYNKGPYVYFGSNAGGRYSGVANSLGVSAYLAQASPKKYQNPTKFQIIAPALDGGFGPGNVVWPSAVVPPGADDMTNFSDGRKLGNP